MDYQTTEYTGYGDEKTHLEYSEKSISGELFDAISQNPKQTAIIYSRERISFEKLGKKILDTEKVLSCMGVKKGDTVAVCLPNIPQAVYFLYAADRIGAIVSFIHPLSSKEELKVYIHRLNPSVVVILDSAVDVFEEVYKETGAVRTIITSPIDELRFIKKTLCNILQKKYKCISDGFESFASLSAKSKKHSLTSEVRDSRDTAVILFSGGTTGVPKGVMLSSYALNAMAYQTAEMCGFSPKGKSMLAVLPLFHGFGLCVCVHTPLIHGATCILVPRFSPSECEKIIKKYRPNFIAGVPTLFEAILREKSLRNINLSFLAGVFSGGDKLPEGLKAKFDGYLKERGSDVKIREGYGLTECVSASCLTPLSGERLGSVGRPFPDTFYKICDIETGEECPFGNIGEICISGPTLMTGYLNNQKETERVLRLHDDGRIWLHTGDAGYMDSDGFLYFSERIKRIIVSSGYNIYPCVIEEILRRCPLVKECCVVGVKDNYRMEKVKAYIVVSADCAKEDNIQKKIKEYCEAHIAKYALPREIEFVSSLPRTCVGKVSYTELSGDES